VEKSSHKPSSQWWEESGKVLSAIVAAAISKLTIQTWRQEAEEERLEELNDEKEGFEEQKGEIDEDTGEEKKRRSAGHCVSFSYRFACYEY
jgi:hypothetical protein